jgi:hypothetical protein
MGANLMEILAFCLSNPTMIVAILGLLEVILGAIPNNVLPYKSVVLGIIKILGSKSEVINEFTSKKELDKLKGVKNV